MKDKKPTNTGKRGETQSANAQQWTPTKNGLKRLISTGVYYIHVKINGQLYRECCNTTDEKAAKDFLADKRAEVEKANASGVDLKNQLTWGHFEEKYRAHLSYRVKLGEDHDEGLKHSSAKTYYQGLDRWNKLWPAVAEVSIRQITDEKIKEKLEPLRTTLSRSQFNRTYIAINEVLKIALKDKAILVNPLQHVKRSSRRQDKTHIPERAEWDRFIDYILHQPGYSNSWKEQVVDFLQGLCVTGLRLSEANAALKEDVRIWTEKAKGQEVKRGTLQVRDGKTKTSIRTIDLIPPAIKVIEHLLERYPQGRELFPIKECYNTFEYVCGSDGLKLTVLDKKGDRKPVRYTHHTCRHIFATLCIENGIDFKTISDWLGHNDGGILVAKTYGHLRRAFAREQAAKVTNVSLVGIPQAASPAPTQTPTLEEIAAKLAALEAENKRLRDQLVAHTQPEPENVYRLAAGQ